MPVILEQNPSVLAPDLGKAEKIRFVSIDIETMDAKPEDIRKVAATLKPPKTYKKATAEKWLKNKRADLIKKAALLDFSPIAIVGIWTGKEGFIIGSVKPKKLFSVIKGVPAQIVHAKDERELLIELRTWLDARTTQGTILIGHNLRGFDLPKLRVAYVRHRLALPKAFHPAARDSGVEVFDTMKTFLWKFTQEKSKALFITLDEMLMCWGSCPIRERYRERKCLGI